MQTKMITMVAMAAVGIIMLYKSYDLDDAAVDSTPFSLLFALGSVSSTSASVSEVVWTVVCSSGVVDAGLGVPPKKSGLLIN